jgi:hypothetical protein
MKGESAYRLRFLFDGDADLPSKVDRVVVSLKHPNELPSGVIAAFSVDEKTVYVKDLARVSELRNFFSRYGIRFEVVPA